jgi:hypothetical protein
MKTTVHTANQIAIPVTTQTQWWWYASANGGRVAAD